MPVTNFPWMQFYTSDWIVDKNLSKCSPATRGIWIDLIASMHQNGRTGEVSGTIEQLARTARCTPEEMKNAVDELRTTETADVTELCAVCTIVNRRMHREHNEREEKRLRTKRSRRSANVPVLKRL